MSICTAGHRGAEFTYIYDRNDYENTFKTSKVYLKWSGIQMTHKVSKSKGACWRAYYWFQFVNIVLAMGSEYVAMAITASGGTFQDAIEIIRMMPCNGFSLLSLVKSYNMVMHRPVYENLIQEIGDMWPVGEVDEEEHEIINSALKQINIVVKAIIVVWMNMCGDFVFCLFMSHITTQFDLLTLKIKKLFYVPKDEQLIEPYPLRGYSEEYLRKNKEAVEKYTQQQWEERHEQEITGIVQQHQALIRLSGDVENMFSLTLLVNVMNSSIVICFCGFCSVVVEKWNETAYKSFLLTALSQTWFVCWYGQKLLDSSEGVAEALYNSGWYRASKKIKKYILIMLHRSHKGVGITTYGFSTISLASYTTIIKTAWSYFTLLLNFSDE